MFCSSQNEELKKKKKREKTQRKKEKLKLMIALDKKKGNVIMIIYWDVKLKKKHLTLILKC